jgi:WD40 repeat protein
MVDDWAGEASSNTDIFWLEGLAGTGKSTISRTVADKLQRQGKLAGSFFFKRGAGDRAHGRRFFTTIACQLAGKLPSMFDHVAAVLNGVHDISSKNIETQFEALLEEPFGSQEGEPRLGNLIIVIDALDECEPSDLSMILPRLARTKLRCFITSRPGIQSTLYSDKLEERGKIYLHKLDESVTREDIRKYLSFELTKLKKKYLGRRRELPHDWPDGDILNGLTDLANPLFIAAATILRMLDAKHIPKSPVELTQDILKRRSNSLKGIESIYNQVLANLPPEFGDKFRQIVGPIIMMFDHLNTTDLSSLLGMSESDIDHCISQLEEILDISDPKSPIRPFHLSLPDFLLGPSPRHEFRIDRQIANRQMTSHCVRLLHKNLQKDVCNIGSPGCRASEVSPELIAECLPPPVQYACLYWIDHLKACGDQLQDHDETHMFLKAKFPMWLEVLSWIGRLDESRRMVYDLQQLADSSAGELASFLEECRMFVSVFLPGVQEAPLQVYYAGLVFTPADSMLGQAFSNLRSSEWNVQVPSIPPNLSSSTHNFTSRKEIKNLSISEDGLLAWADKSGIRVVDSRTGELVRELEGPYNKLSREIDFDADFAFGAELAFGAKLAFGAEGQLAAATWRTTYVWNLKTSQLLQTISGGLGFASNKCLTFSKLDDSLCILRMHEEFTNGSASKYDWKSGICQATRFFSLDEVDDEVVLSPDGQWIGVSSDVGIHVLAFPENGDEQGESYTCGDKIRQITFSTNGMLVAAEHVNQHRVTVWNRETGTVLREIDTDYSSPGRIILTETMIYMGLEGGSITRWSLAPGSITGIKAEQLFVYNSGVRHLAISERCNILASASENNVIRIWHSPVFFPLVQIFSSDEFAFLSLEFGYAGKTVVLNGPRNIMIWDVTDGSLIQSIAHIYVGGTASLLPRQHRIWH